MPNPFGSSNSWSATGQGFPVTGSSGTTNGLLVYVLGFPGSIVTPAMGARLSRSVSIRDPPGFATYASLALWRKQRYRTAIGTVQSLRKSGLRSTSGSRNVGYVSLDGFFASADIGV